MEQETTPSAVKTLLKHTDLAMLGLCVLCFLAAERWGTAPWGGLAFAALGLGGLARGLIIVAARYDEDIDGESGVHATRTGLAAVLYGLHFLIAGIVAIALGVALALEWRGLGAWAREHLWALVGCGGIWLAIIGATTLLGSREGRPESGLDALLQVPGRLIGVIIVLVGLAIAICGLGGINPLRLL